MHKPVLAKEAIEYLDVKTNENFIDATLGEAGHSRAILEKNKPNGKVLGIEWDKQVFEKVKTIVRLIKVNDSYVNLKSIVEKEKFRPVNGIIADLGMSSWHIEESQKGFSFLENEELDMRYSIDASVSAKTIVNEFEQSDLENIFKEYGEERFAKRIASEVANYRKIKKIETTSELVKIIKKAIPLKFQREKINPSTRVFQALRIAVNDELNNLKKFLPQAMEILEHNGRLAVISFHSLEDRIVKNFFKENNRIKIMTKKPIMAGKKEVSANPRARSAKMRVAIKI